MAKTSIHIKACDITGSELHNKRERPLSYVRSELSHLNESFNYTGQTLSTELKRIQQDVKKFTGRKMQKNAIPIKEGVAVISPGTSMADLKKFCDRCQTEFGIVPLQIHIHKDEGHVGSKEWKPNYHAHIVWRMYNNEGRNVRLSQMDCSRMQTILAECLSMERGKASDKQHLDAIQFKNEREKERLKALKEETAKVQAMKSAKEAVFKASEKFKDFLGMTTNDREKEALKSENKALKEEVKSLEQQIGKAKEELQQTNRRLNNRVMDKQFLSQKCDFMSNENRTLKGKLETIGKELHQLLKNVPEENLVQIKERLPAVGEALEATDERQYSRGMRR